MLWGFLAEYSSTECFVYSWGSHNRYKVRLERFFLNANFSTSAMRKNILAIFWPFFCMALGMAMSVSQSVSQSIGAPLWSRLMCFNHYWMDNYEILYRHSSSSTVIVSMLAFSSKHCCAQVQPHRTSDTAVISGISRFIMHKLKMHIKDTKACKTQSDVDPIHTFLQLPLSIALQSLDAAPYSLFR